MVNHQEENRVLIIDDDAGLCSVVCQYLSREGFSVHTTQDVVGALKLFENIKPNVVVCDLRMRDMDGLDFLERIKKNGSTVPVIIATGDPDMTSAIRALQDGAYDYLLKPLQLPVLAQKIRTACQTSRLSRENTVLDETVALFTITHKLAATHNADALLDVLFRYGLELTGAPCGAILQRSDGDSGEVVYARQRGLLWNRDGDGEMARCSLAEEVFISGKPLVIENGSAKPADSLAASCKGIHAMIAVPLRVLDKTVGVFYVERDSSLPVFSALDLTRMEILASQAGIALSNADLCFSVKRKLEALKLISGFSEEISGRMDRYELLRLLFEKVSEHCPIDVAGFLMRHLHRYEFCYWARGAIDEADAWEVCRLAIEKYDETAAHKISTRRVRLQQLGSGRKPGARVVLPLAFTRCIPVDGEEERIGVFITGATVKTQEHDEGETLVAGLVSQIRIALVNSHLYNAMKENYLKTIRALAAAVDAKDACTRGHSEKVMEMAEELAREMKECDGRHIAAIRDAALLHDIGKISIPGHILNKPGPLTYEEFDGIMKKHSAVGANIVKDVPFLSGLYSLILHHHEHYDGSGYPHGLKGEDIPLGARILHVADAFDAMTSDRPYRSSLGHAEAIKRIVADSGKHFDPAIVGVLLRVARRKGIIE